MIPRFQYFFIFYKNKNLNLFGDFHDNFKEGNTVAQEKNPKRITRIGPKPLWLFGAAYTQCALQSTKTIPFVKKMFDAVFLEKNSSPK